MRDWTIRESEKSSNPPSGTSSNKLVLPWYGTRRSDGQAQLIEDLKTATASRLAVGFVHNSKS